MNATDRQLLCFKLHKGIDIVKSETGYYYMKRVASPMKFVDIGRYINMSKNTADRAVKGVEDMISKKFKHKLGL